MRRLHIFRTLYRESRRPKNEAALSTEATYLPDLHQLAVWSSVDLDAPGVDRRIDGERHVLPLTVPDAGDLVVRDVPCSLIDVDAVDEVSGSSSSVDAWRRVLAGTPPAVFPIAAHAEPDPTRTAVTDPQYAVQAFEDSARIPAVLNGGLEADLRPYQTAGVAWLIRTLSERGGAVLADEMGLGKTVQAIGALVARADLGPALVVCPASLQTNWRRELERFAPGLAEQVTILSYARLRTTIDDLAGDTWGTVVFDEAQTLKNPRTQVSRAARRLDADGLIALTGTPVENSLDDLWAILRVVAPTLFPVKAVFRRRFTKAVEAGDSAALHRMRAAVSPVVLGRTKARCAASLPEKIHNPVLCDLTAEQAELYDAHLDRIAVDGFGEGLERHGNVLATLTRLKQICNHPGLVNGRLDDDDLLGRSGKLDVCLEMLEQNLTAGAPTLLFTQYRDTGELLADRASTLAGAPVPFFHGGMSAAARGELADAFQRGDTPPVMVMSLKAGGVGLTLTRACDVIHFDRWWNPAVEAQASDRVHRIGQERTVTVTTLTTANTIEEHIANLHARKSALAADAGDDPGSIVSELAAMDDEGLMALLSRQRAARRDGVRA